VSILSELTKLLGNVPIPVETGVFSGVPPDEYCVLTPMTEDFALHADNRPLVDVAEVRISLFSKGNYLKRKRQITRLLLAADFTITQRRYVAHEDDTGFHNVALDVQKYYPVEEEFPWQQ
jgi:hypothetical protein